MEASFKSLRLSFLFAACLSSSILMCAEDQKNKSDLNAHEAQAKAVMSNVYDSYVKIIPYIYSTQTPPKQFRDKKDKEELLKNLSDLSMAFKSAKHANMFQRPGFRPSLETINDHLEQTIISVEADNYIFAQKRLNVLGALCVSCHSQLPESVSKNAFGTNVRKEKRELFDSDFSYANYLFLVRRFDESKDYFTMALESLLKQADNKSSPEVLAAFRKLIAIDTKIKFNFEAANTFIDKWSADKRLSNNDRKILLRWKENLVKWKGFDPKGVKSMADFIKKNLSPLDMKKEIIFSGEDDVSLLVSSGVLQNYMVENPKSDLAPEILYWLSLIEHRMSQTYFFSLGDLYLKDCIMKYPKSPYAKKCYQEYADSIEAGYSGSAGTEIPEEEKRELVKLKKLLK